MDDVTHHRSQLLNLSLSMFSGSLEQVLSADGRDLFLLDLVGDGVDDVDERVGDSFELADAKHKVVASHL